MKKVKFFRLVWEKSEIGDESIVLKEGGGRNFTAHQELLEKMIAHQKKK